MNAEIIRISSFVGLQNDLNKKSSELSGGMKRRLSVAMALIGDSKVKFRPFHSDLEPSISCFFQKVIILDEPTSGLGKFSVMMAI